MAKKISTSAAPPPFSRYAQAMRVNAGSDLVFVSGQVGVDASGQLASSERGQHEQTWKNLLAILSSEGLGPENIVDVTAYVTSPSGVAMFRDVRDAFLAGHEATSTLLIISGLANPDWLVEIAVVAETPAT
jgi:enamine deaminase RidA (YjgF/YER057c/UK114 family)